MKKRIWKRYLYLIIVGLAVYIGETKDFFHGKTSSDAELVHAFLLENEMKKETEDDLLQRMIAENEKRSEKTEEAQLKQPETLTSQQLQEGLLLEQRSAMENGDEKPKEEVELEPEPTEPEIVRNHEGFVPHEKQADYDWEALKEYKNLIATFYAIDASTASNATQLNLEALTSKDMTIDKNLGPYQILIYHSHSQEAFADSRIGVQEDTIVGMGAYLAKVLSEEYGYGVLHHTAQYDTFRDDAYAVALPEMEKLLAENPSIQVVIDLHRDAGVKGVSRVTNIDGKECATFMLFNGLSYNRKTGSIKYLENPNLADNLAFSFQTQVKAGQYYPGLTRKIYLKGYRYNMHLMPKTLLIELGDSNNTVSQAKNTLDPLAHILHMVLSGE
ncbi:MAG: stage II sporulation protein P [Lachnospiraceae bacterium]|nr:stage II sporulation protein P [Lachnospiraceae bacterium]